MRLLTIQEFAIEAGVNRRTIYNRLRGGEIEPVLKDIPKFRIDADKYPPARYSARKRGAKLKAKI